jgi:hypothetical protein
MGEINGMWKNLSTEEKAKIVQIFEEVSFYFQSTNVSGGNTWVSPGGLRVWDRSLKLTVKIRDLGEHDHPYKILATRLGYI